MKLMALVLFASMAHAQSDEFICDAITAGAMTPEAFAEQIKTLYEHARLRDEEIKHVIGSGKLFQLPPATEQSDRSVRAQAQGILSKLADVSKNLNLEAGALAHAQKLFAKALSGATKQTKEEATTKQARAQLAQRKFPHSTIKFIGDSDFVTIEGPRADGSRTVELWHIDSVLSRQGKPILYLPVALGVEKNWHISGSVLLVKERWGTSRLYKLTATEDHWLYEELATGDAKAFNMEANGYVVFDNRQLTPSLRSIRDPHLPQILPRLFSYKISKDMRYIAGKEIPGFEDTQRLWALTSNGFEELNLGDKNPIVLDRYFEAEKHVAEVPLANGVAHVLWSPSDRQLYRVFSKSSQLEPVALSKAVPKDIEVDVHVDKSTAHIHFGRPYAYSLMASILDILKGEHTRSLDKLSDLGDGSPTFHSPDGRFFAIQARGSQIEWVVFEHSLKKDEIVHRLTLKAENHSYFKAVWSADSRFLAVQDMDEARVYDFSDSALPASKQNVLKKIHFSSGSTVDWAGPFLQLEMARDKQELFRVDSVAEGAPNLVPVPSPVAEGYVRLNIHSLRPNHFFANSGDRNDDHAIFGDSSIFDNLRAP